jgi:hypothetical protein
VLKELNESKSWLEQIVANGLFSHDKMATLIAENQGLCWIVAASVKTAVAGTVQSETSDFGFEGRIGPISDSSERWMSQVY